MERAEALSSRSRVPPQCLVAQSLVVCPPFQFLGELRHAVYLLLKVAMTTFDISISLLVQQFTHL
jgi:hypothetical protein